MADITIEPIVLKDVSLTIPSTTGSDYRKNVSKVQMDPSTPVSTWTGLGGNVHVVSGTTTWTCSLEYAQDWETADSLSQYLLAHAGDTVSITFAPVTGGKSYAVDVLLVPGAIGGAVNAVATASVTLPCLGAPTATS